MPYDERFVESHHGEGHGRRGQFGRIIGDDGKTDRSFGRRYQKDGISFERHLSRGSS